MSNRIVRALVLLASACCSQAASNAAEPAAMFPDAGVWGVVVHTPYRAEALKDVGVQWVRLSVRWRNVEKGARGSYDWADTEELLGCYLEHGFHVMAILTMETLCPLYETDKDDKDVVIGAAARWAGAAAEHFKGKGILWELGNEPEVFPMGGYWDDPVTYTAMARKAAAAIKAADPEAKVAALSVAWMDRGFISQSIETGLLDDGTVDVLTYHGYHRRNMMPESGLPEDVAWLRGQADGHAPAGKHVVVADSERGYAIVPFLEPKAWHSWRNLTYCESEQAAYCARHYLETIWLGVEIAVWYKDMSGEHAFSLYYGTDEDPRGLRPMGHVYRNLAALLPENPKKLKNDRYTVSFVDLPDSLSAPDGSVTVRAFLRSYLSREGEKERLVIALWNPVEAFDNKILDSRKRIGDDYYEAWRAVSPDDHVKIPTQVAIAGLAPGKLARMARCDLLAETTDGAMTPLEHEVEENLVLSPVLDVGPMPAVLVIDIDGEG